jgi:hypothetical protein
MATAKPKTKRMMFGGMAKGPAKPPMRPQPQAAPMRTQSQMQAGPKPSPAAPMRTQSQMQAAAKAQSQPQLPSGLRGNPTDLLNQYNAQKSGATGTGSQQTRTEPSLDDIRGAIKDTQSGKTIAGPMGSQLQSAANAILKGGSSVGSQRALPANPMQKSAQQKLDTTPPPGAIVPMAKTYADFLAQESKNMGNGPQSANTISMPMQSIKSFGQPNSKLPQAISGDAATALGLGKKKGGAVKMAKGGAVKSSASRRGDGIAMRGKTKGRMV